MISNEPGKKLPQHQEKKILKDEVEYLRLQVEKKQLQEELMPGFISRKIRRDEEKRARKRYREDQKLRRQAKKRKKRNGKKSD